PKCSPGSPDIRQQEHVNRSVLAKQIKIVSIPNSRKLSNNESAKYFLNEIVRIGKRHLSEYDRAHNSSIRVLREHTIQIADLENQCLYPTVRRKVRKHCIEPRLPLPEIQVRKGEMLFRNNSMQVSKAIKSTTLAMLLGWDYSDWSGVPIKNMLSDLELKQYQVVQ
ncbi:hypothetical protein V3C99_012206, partial [Haemonchus contortus]